MLKKIQTTVIVLSLIALAAPAFAGELSTDNLYQEGEARQLHIVPAGAHFDLVSGLNDADFDYFETEIEVCCVLPVEETMDIRDTDESVAPYTWTAK